MRKPSWIVSLLPFLILIVSLFFVVRNFGASSLDGASQVALLFASSVAVAISMIFYRTPWIEFEKAIGNNLQTVGAGIIILLFIGAISGSWMISGVVPTMICYGLKIITPKLFLFTCCILCAVISLVTGSSWTTIATIGVALIGIGMAQGYSPGWTAGAIISGAYFGDKISPLSDTTVLASSTSEVPLFEHVRYMMITTVPSFCIACIIFLVVSLCHQVDSRMQIEEFISSLQGSFNITPWAFIVPLISALMIYKKVPAIITLAVSAIVAGIFAIVVQPDIVSEIGAQNSFKGILITYYGDTSIITGNDMLDPLIATHGINGILPTIFLILSASLFGATLVGSGMIQSLTELLLRKISGRTGLVGSTVATGIFADMVTGDQYLSIILTCNLYKKLYKTKGYEPRLLSRSTEDSATVTSVLIPWNSCGMTQSTVLKVRTIEYLPYCFFNLISPLMSILIAATGYKIYNKLKQN